ncbi:unnamed protein product [Calypogeia fissa]
MDSILSIFSDGLCTVKSFLMGALLPAQRENYFLNPLSAFAGKDRPRLLPTLTLLLSYVPQKSQSFNDCVDGKRYLGQQQTVFRITEVLVLLRLPTLMMFEAIEKLIRWTVELVETLLKACRRAVSDGAAFLVAWSYRVLSIGSAAFTLVDEDQFIQESTTSKFCGSVISRQSTRYA